MITNKDLTRRLMYNPSASSPDKVPKYAELRNRALDYAESILRLTPETREQSAAITKLEESLMWAIAAIARPE